MSFLDKDKVLNGVGKAVDTANSAAHKAEKFVKENEIDKKVGSAMNKAEHFVKDMEIDKKMVSAKNKAEDGIKKAGKSIEKGIDKMR